MLEFSARMFFWCGTALEELKADCLIGSMPIPGDQPIFALANQLDETSANKALKRLKHMETEFQNVGLRISSQWVNNLIQELEKPERSHNFQWLMDQLETVRKLTHEELQGKAFFYIPPERMKYWPKQAEPFAFGSKVADSFPSTTFDANNAAFAIATMLSTAAVFHLMRVLEIGLAALGKPFGVSLAHTNWGPALTEIESKIRNMHQDPAWKALPDCKDQQEFYAQAASHFGILKDAWRNYTMHARGKYTEDEAEQIFLNVKTFMQKLAESLSR